MESRLADKFAAVLEHGPELQKKALLRALTELPLRRGDVYDLECRPRRQSRRRSTTASATTSSRSRSSVRAADRMAAAIAPLLDSADPEMRRLAGEAALLVRETRFGEVNRIAGPPGAPTKQLLAKIEQMPEAAEVARVLNPPPPVRTAAGPAGAPRAQRKLDEAFFRGYVEPILTRRGKDGYACVHCHATHTLFDGTYGTAMRVVDTSRPRKQPDPPQAHIDIGIGGCRRLHDPRARRRRPLHQRLPGVRDDPGMDQGRQGIIDRTPPRTPSSILPFSSAGPPLHHPSP